MKILLYSEGLKLIAKSGLGRAIRHQMKALEYEKIDYTIDPKDDYDIAHINTYGLKSYMLAEKAKKNNKKVVYHAHSTYEDFQNSYLFSNQLAPSFKKWIVKCYSLGDYILTPTPYSKKLLLSYGIDKPIQDVSNGINLEEFRYNKEEGEEFRKAYGFTKHDKIVMSVGLFIERKGIIDFVELAKRMPDYKFIWFGTLNLNTVPNKIREAVKTKLPNLFFPGYVEPKELRKAYSGADLFLFLTHEETEGIVLLEALASKQNVLVRDIPIYEDWFKDGVDLYKAKTLEEFEKKIRDIIENRLPSLKENGYRKAEEKDLKKIGIILKEVYEKVLK